MKRKKDLNLLSGSIADKILIFILPVIAGSCFQQMLNSADTAVVGHLIGSRALAAVGSTGPFAGLLINLFSGLAIGANVVISRFLGEGDREKAERGIVTCITISVVLGIVLAGIGLCMIHVIADILSVPDSVRGSAELYLGIYLLGLPFQLLYNMLSAIFRSYADTRKPLASIIFSGFLNIFLDVVFISGFGMDVGGAAAATVLSNVASAAILFVYLVRGRIDLKAVIKKYPFISGDILKVMLRIGLPACLQGVVSSVSHLTIQSSINSLGKDIIAASTVSTRFEVFGYYLVNSFGQAATTFISQNYGAGNIKRCERITRTSMLIGSIFTICFSFIFILAGKYLSFIFTSDQAVIDQAMIRITAVLGFEILDLVIEVLCGVMRGYGVSLRPALICTVGKCGVRVLWVFTAFRVYRSFTVLAFSYAVSWAVTIVMLIPAYHRTKRNVAAKQLFTELNKN